MLDFHGRPVRSLLLASTGVKLIVTAALLLAANVLPAFDSSSATLLQPGRTAYLEPLIRWDTVHFLSIAKHGYTSEQLTAFMPGMPWIMRVGGTWLGRSDVEGMIWTGVGASGIASVLSVAMMYKLSSQLGFPPRQSLLSALLLLLPPSPATFHAVPYTEPLSALCTLTGMYALAQGRLLPAAVAWAAGSMFRAQSIVLGVGFFGWELLLRRPWIEGKLNTRTLTSGLVAFVQLSLISIAPFAMFQGWTYRQFCLQGEGRPWCHVGVGSSYGWVQSEYWNVGPFRYWTLQQLPNFLLAAPVLVCSFWASYTYYSHNMRHMIKSTLPFLPDSLLPLERKVVVHTSRPFLAPALMPYIHLHTALTLLLLISSHVQIVLRVCTTNPVLFWFVADLLESPGQNRERGRRWVSYCAIWGPVSVVLWACFLPPA